MINDSGCGSNFGNSGGEAPAQPPQQCWNILFLVYTQERL
jgi:hypothetical protein